MPPPPGIQSGQKQKLDTLLSGVRGYLDVCEMCELLRVCFNDTGARQDGQRKSLHAASWMS